MLMDAHVGVGGVKNGPKHAHVINGRPQRLIGPWFESVPFFFLFILLCVYTCNFYGILEIT